MIDRDFEEAMEAHALWSAALASLPPHTIAVLNDIGNDGPTDAEIAADDWSDVP